MQGTGPLGVSHLPKKLTRDDWSDHNAMMAFGYVLARSARKKDTMSLLDWGGGIGHYYLYSKSLLPEVAIDYHCYDIPALCRLGRRLLPDVQFHEDPREFRDRRFDLVLSSSSLHYFEDWRSAAATIASATEQYLYVARLQTVRSVPSFVVEQRPHRSGYQTSYLSWFLNREELFACLRDLRMELIREFVFAEEWLVRGAPEAGVCRGFLFRRT